MRFAQFRQDDGTERAGVLDHDELVCLPAGTTVTDMVRRGSEVLLAAGKAALSRRTEVRPLLGAALLPPLVPTSLRDFMTFEQHIDGAVKNLGPSATVNPAWFQSPAFYFTNAAAVVGPHEDVLVPPLCQDLDFELEVAAVLGTSGRDLDLEQAQAAIVGYLVMNDWSARDLQLKEMPVGLGPAKGKDFATTLGPYLVTADELAAHLVEGFLNLTMTAKINDRVVGQDNLSQMAWSFPEMVAYASRGAWVRAGDVLGSGTCGHGCLVELRGRYGAEKYPFLRPGDTVELSVEHLGVMSNRVVAGSAQVAPVPPARRRAWHTEPVTTAAP